MKLVFNLPNKSMKDGGWAVPIGEVGVGLKLCRFIERPRPKCQCWVVMRLCLKLGFEIGWSFFFFLISWLGYQIAKKLTSLLLFKKKKMKKELTSDFRWWVLNFICLIESINFNQSVNYYTCVVAEQPNGPNPQLLTLVLANWGAFLLF